MRYEILDRRQIACLKFKAQSARLILSCIENIPYSKKRTEINFSRLTSHISYPEE
jgi:hypothetical protein